jgi:hypothetical protein
MNEFMHNMSHYCDIIAAPLFFILSIYLYKIKNKTLLEKMLLIFAILGFILDSLFTFDYFVK